FAERLAQAPRHRIQQLVAEREAARLVDRLEMVDGDEQHADRSLLALRAHQRGPAQLLEPEPVRQVGDRVVVGEDGGLAQPADHHLAQLEREPGLRVHELQQLVAADLDDLAIARRHDRGTAHVRLVVEQRHLADDAALDHGLEHEVADLDAQLSRAHHVHRRGRVAHLEQHVARGNLLSRGDVCQHRQEFPLLHSAPCPRGSCGTPVGILRSYRQSQLSFSAMTEPSPIDLRSDTVTRPTDAMRAAIAAAPVGDDQYGEGPTVNRLQQHVAGLFGKEASIWLPSGTMANQVALRVLTRPGDDVIVSRESHAVWTDTGGSAANAGVQFTEIGSRGVFTAEEFTAAVKPRGHVIYPPTTLVEI